ncbi:MAG TPA: substrate-binding domain-containing protein, partial [Acidimicrobiales bacterium]|nr:substrate-binding domain-containing protein [Acidimicrobiales bacterium]
MVSLGLGLSAALVLASCSSGTAATSGSGKSGGIDIALSNSYIGNTWRIEMENEYKAACHMPPFKGHVKCSVYNANNNVSSQKQQLSGMVASGVQAIVTDAASPTGLNGTIKQACSRGILVVSFDNTV